MKYRSIANIVDKKGVVLIRENDIITCVSGIITNITTGEIINTLDFKDIVGMLVSITDEIPSKISVEESINPDLEKFKAITDKMLETFERKNHDYGNSFDKSLDKFGLIASLVRMEDKTNRLESLLTKEAKVEDESIRDSLLDLSVYCILTIMWLDKNGKN